jgi:hypothetical protein
VGCLLVWLSTYWLVNFSTATAIFWADAEPEPWERAAFQAAVHSDPIELAGAKRALKAFFLRLLPDIKVEDSFGEADQVFRTPPGLKAVEEELFT